MNNMEFNKIMIKKIRYKKYMIFFISTDEELVG